MTTTVSPGCGLRVSAPQSPGAPSAKAVGNLGPARFFAVPGQIVSLVVLVMPLLVALYMSFTDWSPTRGSLAEAYFVGLENYYELLVYDSRFIEAVLLLITVP